MPTNAKDWFTAREVADLLNVSERTIRRKAKEFTTKVEKCLGGERYLFHFDSLPSSAKATILKQHNTEQQLTLTNAEEDLNVYATLKPWEREYIDYIIPILKASEGLKGKALDEFLEKQRNECKNGKKRSGLSTNNFYKVRGKYEQFGLKGIVPGYGKNEGSTIIDEASIKYFEEIYLREKGPSAMICWVATKGEWIRTHAGEIPENFPSLNSFLRLLQQRKPYVAIELARKGQKHYDRKYAPHNERIYDGIKAGEIWVGDHMQCNNAVISVLPKSIREDVEKLLRYDKVNKPIFPWITVWRCFLTGKWMGWNIHAEAPNSDHIFAAFIDGAERYGIPNEIYIDNGKDYRSKDFSSGKTKRIKVKVDETRTVSLMSMLGIIVHFAIAYNPQSKPIEVDFGKYQTWFDQGMPGYRGRNSNDRPETLLEQIRKGELLDFAEYSSMIDYFVENVFNEYESKGKNLLGKSRNDAFAESYEGLRKVSHEALKMFCLRISDEYTVGKNGVTVNQDYNLYYYAAWMFPLKGTKVFLRRDPKRYQFAYVFKYEGENIEGEYLGKAYLNIMDTHAMAKTDIDKEQLRKVQAFKTRERKLTKELAKVNKTDPRRYLENIAASAAASRRTDRPELQQNNVMMKTLYDEVLQKDEEIKKTGTYGFDISKSETKKTAKILTFFTDKEELQKHNKKGDDSNSSPKI